MDWGCITPTTTLVLFMPGAEYAEVAARLREGGMPEDLPCVIVSNATTPQQQIRHSNVAKLGAEPKLPAPALLIVGRVAANQINEIAAGYWCEAEQTTASRPPSGFV